VDVDPRHGGQDGLRTLEMQHSALPGTWTVETRHSGTHRYYLLPDHAQLAQSTHLAAGVEVLGPQCPLTIPGFGVCVVMERKPGKCMLPLPPLPSHDAQPPVLLAA